MGRILDLHEIEKSHNRRQSLLRRTSVGSKNREISGRPLGQFQAQHCRKMLALKVKTVSYELLVKLCQMTFGVESSCLTELVQQNAHGWTWNSFTAHNPGIHKHQEKAQAWPHCHLQSPSGQTHTTRQKLLALSAFRDPQQKNPALSPVLKHFVRLHKHATL